MTYYSIDGYKTKSNIHDMIMFQMREGSIVHSNYSGSLNLNVTYFLYDVV